MPMHWPQSTGASSLHSPQSSFATQQKIKLPGFQTLVHSMPWKQCLLAPLLFFPFSQLLISTFFSLRVPVSQLFPPLAICPVLLIVTTEVPQETHNEKLDTKREAVVTLLLALSGIHTSGTH